MTQAVAHIDLQTVVRADALGEPARCIGELWVGQGGVCGIVKSARGEVRRAGRRRANRGDRNIGIDRQQLVITVRSDVTDRERGVRGDLLFDLQRVRFHGGSLEIRLYAAGRNLRASGDGRSGNNVDARKRDVFQGQDGVERTVLVKAITKIVVQCVVQPEASANHGGLR